MDTEAVAAANGYRLTHRNLDGRLVWWWQLVANPEDTRQPCWLERRQAVSYMRDALQRAASRFETA